MARGQKQLPQQNAVNEDTTTVSFVDGGDVNRQFADRLYCFEYGMAEVEYDDIISRTRPIWLALYRKQDVALGCVKGDSIANFQLSRKDAIKLAGMLLNAATEE